MDESKDASQKEQISVILWYLQPLSENIHEEYLHFTLAEGLDVDSLLASIKRTLSQCYTDLRFYVVQCYDGAIPCTLRHYKSSTSFFWVSGAQSFPEKTPKWTWANSTARRNQEAMWHSLGMPDHQENSCSNLGYVARQHQPFKPTLEDRGRSYQCNY